MLINHEEYQQKQLVQVLKEVRNEEEMPNKWQQAIT